VDFGDGDDFFYHLYCGKYIKKMSKDNQIIYVI